MLLSFTVTLAKVESVETCEVYDAALAAVFHNRVAFVLMSSAPFAGEDNVGTCGGAIVEKCHTNDHGLTPNELEARTRQ